MPGEARITQTEKYAKKLSYLKISCYSQVAFLAYS